MPDAFTWDASRRRYLSPKGREVPPERVREWVKEASEKSRERLKGFAEDYKAGRVNHAQFFINLNEEITRAHSAVAMIASGGKSQMTPSLWGRAGQRVGEQRGFSRRFAAETLETDRADFPAWRAESYANVYGHTFENMILARDMGRKVERVLGSSEEHCPDCPGKAGVYDAADAPPIGGDSCNGGCNCYYREAEEVTV